MRRTKMRPADLYELGIDYFYEARVKNSNGERGWRYVLDKPLTPEQEKAVRSFKNTIISTATHRYAPEIVHQTIIILDKCRKEVA